MAFKRLNRKQMEALSDSDLTAYIQRQDAAEAIAEGCTRQAYVSMHKPTAQDAAALAWDQVTA